MDILFLGNGFDLHHKLPTSYFDFLSVVQFLNQHYDDTMVNVAQVFGDERLQHKNKSVETSYEYYEGFYKEVNIDKIVIEELIKKSKSNMWFKYLSKSLEKNLTWIDFEKEIYKVILAFDEFFVLNNTSINSENERTASIVSNFDFFIKEGNKDYFNWFWSAEELRDEYVQEFPVGSELLEIDEEKIIKDLYEALRELADMLKMYLKIFIDGLLKQIKNFNFAFKNSDYQRANYVCTFNYTNTYELLYEPVSSIAHIHGTIEKNIVLGVNPDKFDDLENIDTSFVYFKKYFQRVFYRTDIEYLKLIEEMKLTPANKDVKTVYVVGHSLDKTDEDVIKQVFALANKIKVFYHEEYAMGKLINNLVSIYGKAGLDELREKKGLEFLFHQPAERYQLEFCV